MGQDLRVYIPHWQLVQIHSNGDWCWVWRACYCYKNMAHNH